MNVKFTGDFKKLIPMGFKFHKLYAKMYKVYVKNGVWIWVARGGYVEVDDLYDMSGYVIEKVLNETYPVYEKDIDYKVFKINKGQPKSCIMNMDTGDITPYADFIRSLHPEQTYNHEIYREFNLLRKTRDTIIEIKNMIKVESSGK